MKTDADRRGAVASLDKIVHRIRSGERGLAENTRTLRKLLSGNKVDAYKQRKANILSAATFSGIFSTRDASVSLPEKFTTHTGLLTFDVDGVKRDDLPVLKSMLSQHPNISLLFTSPSYEGLKGFLSVDPTPTTADDLEHKHIWAVCVEMINALLLPYGYQCDSGNDPTRLCFLAHAPYRITPLN